jgi:hypothetical protein
MADLTFLWQFALDPQLFQSPQPAPNIHPGLQGGIRLGPGPVLVAPPPEQPSAEPGAPRLVAVDDDDPPGVAVDGKSILLSPGITYLFPEEHITIHLISAGNDPTTVGGQSQVTFDAYRVPANMVICEVLKQLGLVTPQDVSTGLKQIVQYNQGWVTGVTIRYFHPLAQTSLSKAYGNHKDPLPLWLVTV